MSQKQTVKVGDLVEVYWDDHSSRDQWADKGCTVAIIQIRSVGWVDRMDAKVMQLYASETNNDRVSQQALIIRKCITRMQVVKPAARSKACWSKK